jgi:peptide-methionine (S)-S-oxide reductase
MILHLLITGLMMTSNMTFARTTDTIVLAMGCFWCAETANRDEETHQPLPGIIDIKAGYAGGTKPNPTYEDHPGYIEAIKITFDPKIISLEKLLKLFWVNIDPFDASGQFCDKGNSYISAIYFGNQKHQQSRRS